jgi:hypothetical protein
VALDTVRQFQLEQCHVNGSDRQARLPRQIVDRDRRRPEQLRDKRLVVGGLFDPGLLVGGRETSRRGICEIELVP